ncbi:MAG: hypothetical protein IJS19_06765 [Muribaculaceae bacterium]|nr:hypothetical protein [Muribaculaceae bacterium]MBQ7212347.1 hypothetical protein [Muribaculaceae bacterium]
MSFRIVLIGCLLCGVGLLPNSCDCSGTSYYSDTTEEVYDSCALDSPAYLDEKELNDILNWLNSTNVNNHVSLPQPQYYEDDSNGPTPDDAYDEGREEGYEDGYEDGLNGYGRGANYSDSNSYYGYYDTRYCEGYEEGYDDGYADGHRQYELMHEDDDDYDFWNY